MHDFRVQAADEHLHHHRAFVQAQQAVVDEDAGQLVADRTVDQRRSDARVDATRQAEDDLLLADLSADQGHRLGNVVAHHPIGPGLADVQHEALEQRLPLHRVRDLGMELHGVIAACLVGHAGDRTARCRGHQLETRGQFGDLVAVAHPDFEHAVAFGRGEVLQAFEQLRVAARPHLRIAELAMRAGLDLAPLLHRHREHAIADAEHRHTKIPHGRRCAQVVFFVGAGVAAREHDAFRIELADEGVAYVIRMNLAIDMRFADAAGDELSDLRAEVEDEDLVVGHGIGLGIRTGRRAKWRQASTSEAAWRSAQKYIGAPMRQSPCGK